LDNGATVGGKLGLAVSHSGSFFVECGVASHRRVTPLDVVVGAQHLRGVAAGDPVFAGDGDVGYALKAAMSILFGQKHHLVVPEKPVVCWHES
jgi:fermentation-respiration switch protein FrsA (DUF1100 family)